MSNHGHPTEGERIGGTLAQDHSPSNALGGEAGTKEMDPRMAHMHLDHVLWLNSLRFYREELYILKGHLEQFVRTAGQPEQMAQVEHFQNKFLRETEVIDELAHAIKGHEGLLQNSAPHLMSSTHADLADRMATYERLYAELKQEFRTWLAASR